MDLSDFIYIEDYELNLAVINYLEITITLMDIISFHLNYHIHRVQCSIMYYMILKYLLVYLVSASLSDLVGLTASKL